MKLTYVMNPLCSWCYGMNWLLAPFYQQYASHLQISFLPARPLFKSMLLGSPELALFMQRQDQQVQWLTGARFSVDRYRMLLSKREYQLDSMPAIRAVSTMQHLDPSSVFPFALAVQKAHFEGSCDLRLWQTYRGLLKDSPVSPEMFLYAWQSCEVEKLEESTALNPHMPTSLLDHRVHGDTSMLSATALTLLKEHMKRHLMDESQSMPA